MKIKNAQLNLKEGTKLELFLNSKKFAVGIYAERMMDYSDGTWVLYNGSSLWGMPELGRVRKDTSTLKTKIKVGDNIKWRIKK